MLSMSGPRPQKAMDNHTSLLPEPWADDQKPLFLTAIRLSSTALLQGNGVIGHPGHGYPESVIRQPSENIPYSPLSGCFHKAIAGTMLMKELTLSET